MLKLFKPVFDYKLSFDPNKGDKYTIKVVYTVAMDAQGRIGAAIPPPAALLQFPEANWTTTNALALLMLGRMQNIRLLPVCMRRDIADRSDRGPLHNYDGRE